MKASRNIGLGLVFLFVLTAVPVMAEVEFPYRYAMKWEFPEEGENPDNWIVENECGEDVRVSGWFHDQWVVHTDAAGGEHWVNHWRAQGKGVGVETGAQFVFKGGDLRLEDPNGGSAVWSQNGVRLASTSTPYMKLTGQGQVPNYHMRCVVHTTINANGEMVTEFTHCSIRCD